MRYTLSMLKALVLVAILWFAVGSKAYAAVYYVSSTGNDSNAGTSMDAPWLTIAHVRSRMSSINAGDSVLFRRGDVFVGEMIWTKSGAAGSPITFGAYGTGAKPILEFPRGSSTTLEDRNTFAFYGTSYITVDSINFTDRIIAADPDLVADKEMFANGGVAVRFGADGSGEDIHDNIISNCDCSFMGMGFVIQQSNHTVITHNTIVNLKNLVNTVTPDYEDYAANAVTISGNDNVVSYNYINGAWATSLDFGSNGGAIEFYYSSSRNQIIYNTIIDSGGVAEFGSGDGGMAADNLIAYNVIINSGDLLWSNISGIFAIQVSNLQFYNNIVISDSTDRFVIDPARGGGGIAFGYNGSPTATTVYNIKNNIFYFTNGLDLMRSSAGTGKYILENNIYHFEGGSTAGHTLTSSELTTTATLFESASSADATMWNLHPATGSPSIGFGQALGFSVDLDGTALASPPCAGAYEYGAVVVDAGVDSGTSTGVDLGMATDMGSTVTDMGSAVTDMGTTTADMGITVTDASVGNDAGTINTDSGTQPDSSVTTRAPNQLTGTCSCDVAHTESNTRGLALLAGLGFVALAMRRRRTRR